MTLPIQFFIVIVKKIITVNIKANTQFLSLFIYFFLSTLLSTSQSSGVIDAGRGWDFYASNIQIFICVGEQLVSVIVWHMDECDWGGWLNRLKSISTLQWHSPKINAALASEICPLVVWFFFCVWVVTSNCAKFV